MFQLLLFQSSMLTLGSFSKKSVLSSSSILDVYKDVDLIIYLPHEGVCILAVYQPNKLVDGLSLWNNPDFY